MLLLLSTQHGRPGEGLTAHRDRSFGGSSEGGCQSQVPYFVIVEAQSSADSGRAEMEVSPDDDAGSKARNDQWWLGPVVGKRQVWTWEREPGPKALDKQTWSTYS